MIIAVGDKLLFMHAVGNKTVLTADVAAADRVQLEGQRGTAAGVVVDLRLHLVRIDVRDLEP